MSKILKCKRAYILGKFLQGCGPGFTNDGVKERMQKLYGLKWYIEAWKNMCLDL